MFNKQGCKTVLRVLGSFSFIRQWGVFLTGLHIEINYRHHKLGLSPSLKFSIFFQQISFGFLLTK